MIPCAALATIGPYQLRELAKVQSIARKGHPNETLAITIVTPRLTEVDGEEAHKHVWIERMPIDPGKIDVPRAMIFITLYRDELEWFICINAPGFTCLRLGENNMAPHDMPSWHARDEPSIILVGD